jgi:PII-like signaling protein
MLETRRMMRVFVDESEVHGGVPAYERVVRAARDGGLAGATVLRGVAGFGHTRHIHTAKVLQVDEHVPMVVEIVDTAERLQDFAPAARAAAPGATILLLDVQVFT